MRSVLICVPIVIVPLLLGGCDPDRDVGPGEDPEPTPTTEIRTSGGPELAAPPLLSRQALQLPKSGFEGRKGLETLDWVIADYANPGQAFHVSLAETPGEAPDSGAKAIRLAIELFGGPAYSTALRCDGAWSLRVDPDAETVLVIHNAAPAALQGSLAYTLSDRFVWHESRTFLLKPGWNTVRVKQGGTDFKTRRSGWQHTAPLRRPEACSRITLLFHNGRRTGRLFIDYVSVAGTPIESPELPPVQSPK